MVYGVIYQQGENSQNSLKQQKQKDSWNINMLIPACIYYFSLNKLR